MSVEFNYTREWTDAEAFPLLSFKRNWENPEDYPTIETDERKVREDMQSLHDEVKDFLNNELIPRVVAEDATLAAWQAQEDAHAQAEVGRADAEANRVSAETERANAEQERKNAESSRASAELGRSGAEQIRVTAEENRVASESARVEAENARVEAEQKREDLETGYVAQAKASAESAAQSAGSAAQSEENAAMSAGNAEYSAMNAMGYALGGSVSDPMGFILDFPGTKYYAEVAKAYTEGGSFSPDPLGNNVTQQRVDGAENEAAKAQAFAEGGTYKEWVTTAPGQSAWSTKTVEMGAKQYAEEAERLAKAAANRAVDAASSKTAAAESATAAATSAIEAAASATTATNEADRAKAEADRAKNIVGGDYATREEATSIANTAENNANSYTDLKIADVTNTILDVNTGEIQTWDGYTDGLVHSIDRFNNFTYFKVSDATPNAEELGRGIITETTTQGDSTENSDCYLEDFAGVLHLRPSLGYGSVVVIPEGFGGVLIDFYGTPTTFPESGTYFSKESFYWTSSLKISGYTGFEKTVTIKEELLPSAVVTRDVLAELEAKVEENTRLANDAYTEAQAAYEEARGVGDELDTHERSSSSHSDIREWVAAVQATANSKAPMYTYGTTDLTAGSSELATGQLHFVYE